MKTIILFLMFFTSPPAKPGKQVWTLNSTQHFEFANMPACRSFGLHLWSNFEKTVTTTLRGWCVDNETGVSTQDVRPGEPNPHYFEIGPDSPKE